MAPTHEHGPDGPRHELLERRLQAALEARAYTIGPGDLRAPAPPSETVRKRFPTRATALTLFALAAVVACVFLVTGKVGGQGEKAPVEPARPEKSHSPTPTHEHGKTPHPSKSHAPSATRSPGPKDSTSSRPHSGPVPRHT